MLLAIYVDGRLRFVGRWSVVGEREQKIAVGNQQGCAPPDEYYSHLLTLGAALRKTDY